MWRLVQPSEVADTVFTPIQVIGSIGTFQKTCVTFIARSPNVHESVREELTALAAQMAAMAAQNSQES